MGDTLPWEQRRVRASATTGILRARQIGKCAGCGDSDLNQTNALWRRSHYNALGHQFVQDVTVDVLDFCRDDIALPGQLLHRGGIQAERRRVGTRRPVSTSLRESHVQERQRLHVCTPDRHTNPNTHTHTQTHAHAHTHESTRTLRLRSVSESDWACANGIARPGGRGRCGLRASQRTRWTKRLNSNGRSG
jgi:hypothetical protein